MIGETLRFEPGGHVKPRAGESGGPLYSGPALPCPKCRRVLDSLSWHNAGGGTCWNCRGEFEFTGFPALTAAPVRAVPKAVLVAEHATCFFHAENQAETPCDSCGRFLCAVCAIDFSAQRFCPSCVSTARTSDTRAITQRTLYEGIAMAVALLPMLMWPLTLITAPVALGVVIVGWRKPRSLVGGGKGKLVIAGIFALLQIGGWVLLGATLLLKKR